MYTFFCENVCPIYKEAYLKASVSYDGAEDEDERREILNTFAQKYLMPPAFWRRLIEPERQFFEPQPADVKDRRSYRGLGGIQYQMWPESEELHEEAYSKWADGWNERIRGHLYSSSCMFTKHKYYQWFDKHIEWDNVGHLGTLLKYVRQFDETAPLCEKALCFPHKHLEKVREIHEAFGVSPISNHLEARFKKACSLYKKFVEAGDDDEKWLECLKELDDEEAVIANIELRLGKGHNYLKKPLWTFYMDFLKHRNPTAMLDVYRRFNRLFISDSEMREKYRSEIERVAKDSETEVTRFWIDTIQFEVDFGDSESAYSVLERALKSVLRKPIKLLRRSLEEFRFSFEIYQHEMRLAEFYRASKIHPKPSKTPLCFQNPTEQRILPTTMLSYIYKLAKASVLQKLHLTCKYLFAYRPLNFCHNLIIYDESVKTKCIGQSLLLSHHDLDFPALNNLYLTHRLSIYQEIQVHDSGWICPRNRDEYFVSKLITKTQKCELKYLMLNNQTLTLDEFEFLISSGTIEKLKISGLTVFDGEEKLSWKSMLSIIQKHGIDPSCVENSSTWLN